MTLLTRSSRFSRSTPHKTEIISFQIFPRRSQRICELFPIVASAFLDNLVGFNRACSGPALHLYGFGVNQELARRSVGSLTCLLPQPKMAGICQARTRSAAGPFPTIALLKNLVAAVWVWSTGRKTFN